MIKRLLLIYALLIPTHASAHDWHFMEWLHKTEENVLCMAICYTYLLDDNTDTFLTECDINTAAMEYDDLLFEFYSERDINHHGMTDAAFIAEHFDGILVPHLQQNFKLQTRAKAAIMTLLLAENMLYSP